MNDPYDSTAAALFCAAVGRLDGQRQVGTHPEAPPGRGMADAVYFPPCSITTTLADQITPLRYVVGLGIAGGAIREAMVRRALEPDQWTYAEMSRVAERAGGNERNADKFNQTLRRENHATPYRDGKRVFWALTAAGRAALAAEVGA